MDPFLGLIKLYAFGFAPSGWLLCNGVSLTIQQNNALYSLIGTTFGGNSSTSFNLPNLTGTAPVTNSTQPMAYYIATMGLYPMRP